MHLAQYDEKNYCTQHQESKPCIECIYEEMIEILVENVPDDTVIYFVAPNLDLN